MEIIVVVAVFVAFASFAKAADSSSKPTQVTYVTNNYYSSPQSRAKSENPFTWVNSILNVGINVGGLYGVTGRLSSSHPIQFWMLVFGVTGLTCAIVAAVQFENDHENAGIVSVAAVVICAVGLLGCILTWLTRSGDFHFLTASTQHPFVFWPITLAAVGLPSLLTSVWNFSEGDDDIGFLFGCIAALAGVALAAFGILALVFN